MGAELTARIRQPAVIGELVMGMIVGASVLGWVAVGEGGVIEVLAEIGVILLLFEVGLETDVRSFIRLGAVSTTIAIFGVVAPFVLGFFGSLALDLGGGSTEVAIFIGAAMTATSVGITARVFADLRRLQTDEARAIIGAAVIDDIIGLIILAVVAGTLGTEEGFGFVDLATVAGKAVLFLGVVAVIGAYVGPWYFRFLKWMRVEGSFVVGAFIFAIAIGLAAEELAGLDPIVGAFAAGLVASETVFDERIARELRPISYLFVPIFFLSIGARVDVGVLLEPEVLLAGGVISLLAIVGKLAAAAGTWRTSLQPWVVGVGMIPRGEVGLIFAALGADQLAAVVGAEETAIVVLMVVVTTLAAPLVLHRMLSRGTDEILPEEESIVDSPITGGPERDPTASPDG